MSNRLAPLIGLSFAHFVNDFYQFLIPLLLPFLIPEFRFSYFYSGVLVAAYLGVSVVLNPIVGHFADTRRRRKEILCFGLAFFAISLSALRFATNYATLFILSLVPGIGFSGYHPQATKFISTLYGKRMGRNMGLHGIGGGLGIFAAPVVLVPLISIFGWRDVVSFLFIPGCVVALVLWKILDEPKTTPCKTAPNLRIRPLMLLSIVHGFGGFVFRGFVNFLPLYFVAARGTTIIEMGLLTGLLLAAGIVAEPLGGAISDTIGRRRLFTISLSVLMVSLLAFLNTSGLVSLIWLVVIGFSFNATMPVGLTYASELAPAERTGMCVGIVFGSSMAFGLASTLMVGAMIDVFDFYWSFMGLSLFAGVAAILSLLLPKVKAKS